MKLNNPLNSIIDRLEGEMTSHPRVECPITHRFTPGMYIREILIPAGTLLTSMEHRTVHPFVISQGRIWVSSENEGSVVYEAPHTGITLPGTRRALYAETDTIWTTFHATELTDVAAIGEAILAPPSNPLLEGSRQPQWRDSLPPDGLRAALSKIKRRAILSAKEVVTSGELEELISLNHYIDQLLAT